MASGADLQNKRVFIYYDGKKPFKANEIGGNESVPLLGR